MEIKMKKKRYVIILVTTIAVALNVPVKSSQAVTITEVSKEINEIVPRYMEINDIKKNFDIVGTSANMKISVFCSSTKKVSIKIVLQRKDNDSWIKVQTWTKTGMGTQTLSKSMTVTKGRKYRMKYTVTVGSETVTDKTAAKTA